MYQYKAKVLKVVDGDTFDAEVDLGFNMFARVRFRLKGFDTPEVHRPKNKEELERGLAAKRLVESLILNKVVTLNTYKEAVYNRWEADCILPGGGSLKERLQDAGMAKA
jgi:micrococcal nuclease